MILPMTFISFDSANLNESGIPILKLFELKLSIFIVFL